MVRSAGRPSISRRPVLWPYGKSTATEIHFQPSAAMISLEEIAQDRTAGLLVCFQTNKQCAPIGCADGVLGQHAADLVWLVKARAAHIVPDLLLAGMVASDREGHELIERRAVSGI